MTASAVLLVMGSLLILAGIGITIFQLLNPPPFGSGGVEEEDYASLWRDHGPKVHLRTRYNGTVLIGFGVILLLVAEFAGGGHSN